MSVQDDVTRVLRKLADDVAFGKYGSGDDFGAAAFWEDWDTAQDELTMYAPDADAE